MPKTSKSPRTGRRSPAPAPAPARSASPKQPKRRKQSGSGYLEDRRRARPAADNLLAAIGGKPAALTILDDSAHPKAALLADRLRSPAHLKESFATSYVAVGLKAVDIVEIFRDVTQAKALIGAIASTDTIFQSVIRQAGDWFEPHDKCEGSGWVLDGKGQSTGKECFKCQGTGQILRSGSLDAQNLFFELTQMKKSGALVNIDARRSTQTLTVYGAPSVGAAPNPVVVLQRADQVELKPASAGLLNAASPSLSNPLTALRDADRMEVIEAEEVL